jgi:metallo-beta-lactamase family protein
MKIAFHGAAWTVTGSKHLLTLKNGKKILLDSGLFQGMGKETDALNRVWGFDPAEVDILVLSHAHIDHCGLIPKLVKDGFSGPIYCTPGTRSLAYILLEDSAEIQEDDVKYINKKRAASGQPYLKPLYTLDDAKACFDQFKEVDTVTGLRFLKALTFYLDDGHIIGGAAVHLRAWEVVNRSSFTFGDVVVTVMLSCVRRSLSQADYILGINMVTCGANHRPTSCWVD